MKKIIPFMVLYLICLIWKYLHFQFLYPEYTEVKIAFQDIDINLFLSHILLEEIQFRIIPISLILISIKLFKKNQYILRFTGGIFILLFQVWFSISHLPDDEVFREVILELPKNPSIHEYLYALSSWGVPGVCYTLACLIYIKLSKKFLYKILNGLIASSVLHLLYNLYCLGF